MRPSGFWTTSSRMRNSTSEKGSAEKPTMQCKLELPGTVLTQLMHSRGASQNRSIVRLIHRVRVSDSLSKPKFDLD
ncbi:hypothetical protein E4U30_004565 [Claviceps sp. LM220 group G6]|nr:hypothetical protein E4U30_004565 [Claviceps sp. LM220 group G6]